MNVEDYAIVIGIDNYRADPRLQLNAAEHDAVGFLRWLRSPRGGGVPKGNTCVFLSRFYPPNPRAIRSQPMKNDIDDTMIELGMDQDQRIGRRLYFYFAGHGIGPSLHEVSLLMANATRRTLGNNLGIQDYLQFFINWAPFDEVVVFLDCCRDLEESFAAMPTIFTKDKRDGAPDVKYMVALAARYGQKSWEVRLDDNDWRPRCLFTHVLLDGLRQAVDEHGAITGDSLSSYLYERLPELASKFARRQKPEITGEFEKQIFFQKPRAETVPQITIPIPAGWSGELEIRDNQGVVASLVAAPGDQTGQAALAPGLYSLVSPTEGSQYMVVEPGSQEAKNVQLA